jgi:hypothetical protein
MQNMNAMSMHNASNLQKELMAMSVAAAASLNAAKEIEPTTNKSKKGKTTNRGSYQQNKSMPQHYPSSSRALDGPYDMGISGSLAPSKSKSIDMHGSAYSK